MDNERDRDAVNRLARDDRWSLHLRVAHISLTRLNSCKIVKYRQVSSSIYPSSTAIASFLGNDLR